MCGVGVNQGRGPSVNTKAWRPRLGDREQGFCEDQQEVQYDGNLELGSWEKKLEPQQASDLEGDRERGVSEGTPISSLDSSVSEVTRGTIDVMGQEWKPEDRGGGRGIKGDVLD